MCVFTPTECEADDDCLEGFECIQVEECMGGGSGCACTECACPDCPDGEECPPCDCPDEPVCECDEEPEEWEECEVIASVCLPAEVPCENDEDCPGDFVCMEDPEGTDCLCPACACPDCPPGEECEGCECPPCDCGGGEAESFCVPEGWDEVEFWGTGGGAETSADGQDNGKDGTEDPEAPDPDAPDDEEEGTPGGDQGDADGTGDDGGDQGSGETGGTQTESSGCSATPNGTFFSLLMLLLALLSLSATRRFALRRNR